MYPPILKYKLIIKKQSFFYKSKRNSNVWNFKSNYLKSFPENWAYLSKKISSYFLTENKIIIQNFFIILISYSQL